MDGIDIATLRELFILPFLTGLVLAVLLPLLGCYLRLRGEWLAALGFSHIAAAGSVLGLPLGLPTTLTATVATTLAALANALIARMGNSQFALMLVLGWAGALFLAANTNQGEVISEGLLRGQLYFSTAGHLVGALITLAGFLLSLHWLNRRLLIQRFFPDYYAANGRTNWHHELLFVVLLVPAVVLGTLAIGALPAFALFFVPAWVAFGLVRSWKHGLWLSAIIGASVYLLAFFIALLMNQPFGPLLALLLALTSVLRLVGPIKGQNSY
ncbi:zinc transport system permease protein [Halospina denitrificans]|uniref:Zinc transport system permease protein n=1 Tax=Halospina denitrificans TaxID=332522 RepID=A0A4V3EQZ3_9GAMM|nr:metal ABC transporter permease [Halospina denitrificans]TDT44068.1 zinc transport system permease protein [Halospina denitrificans]